MATPSTAKRQPLAAIKGVARNALWRSGVTRFALRRRNRAYILMLHGVGVDGYEVDDFDDLLTYLRREFRIVHLADLMTYDGTMPVFDEPTVALTFDDGLRNNVTHAYPVLQSHSAPATFFVCPGLIDAGGWLWTHELRARLEMLLTTALGELAAACGIDEGMQIDGFVERCKRMDVARRADTMTRVAAATAGFVPSDRQRADYALATWSDLASLDPALVVVGSHSSSHSIMVGLDSSQLHEEVVASRSRIEARLGRSAEFFCYPNGDYDDAALAAVRAAYSAAVSTRVGSLGAGTQAPHELPRVAVDDDLSALSLNLARA